MAAPLPRFAALLWLACCLVMTPGLLRGQEEEEILLDEEEFAVEVEEEPAAKSPGAEEPVAEAAEADKAKESVEKKKPVQETTEPKTGMEDVKLDGDGDESAKEPPDEMTEEPVPAKEEEPKADADEAAVTPETQLPGLPKPEAVPAAAAKTESDVETGEQPAGKEDESGEMDELDAADAALTAEPDVETEAEASAEAIEPILPSVARKARPRVKTPSLRGGFAEFLRCGMAVGEIPIPFSSSVIRVAVESGLMAVNEQEIVVSGVHPEGTLFAAYNVPRETCAARYIGLVLVLAEIGDGSCRAVVKKAEGPIGPGDSLFPLEDVEEEFSAQWEMAGEGAYVNARVKCLPLNRRVISVRREVIQLDAGAGRGVRYGQVFELVVPGNTGNKTYGRVIRVDDSSCFVKLLRVFQPVEIGDRLQTVSPSGEAKRGAPKADGGISARRR